MHNRRYAVSQFHRRIRVKAIQTGWTLQEILFQSHVVAVGVNTWKKARRSALFPQRKITTQTSAKANLKKRKAIIHSNTKPAIRTVPEPDTICKGEEIIENQAIVMTEFSKCQVTMKMTGNPIQATFQVTNVLFTT